ncbi:unnamed protein product [Adineta ricciae]|uniref:BAH domain-containing protein n=1 Tax=Adineta ricciae TaxID=249248 RepID=A0A813T4K5_ADIRI|nr:unnamed protein product [Adineta ricciae]
MSQRTRFGKTSATSNKSPSKSKAKSRMKKTSIKKVSPTKLHNESISTNLIQPRQKRLSSLTAAALVHYCTSILSPKRKVTHTKKTSPKNATVPARKRKISNVSSKSETKNVPADVQTRTRREASLRASAMIMQHNEIERSRYSYTLANNQSTSETRRQRTRSGLNNKTISPTEEPKQIPDEPFKFNIPSVPPLPIPVPSITTVSNQSDHTQSSPSVTAKSTYQGSSSSVKYPSLTEAVLAEHDRLNETLPSYHTIKHDNLIKWTQELALYGRLSPHDFHIESMDDITDSQSLKMHGNTKEISISSMTDSILSTESLTNHPAPAPSFIFPSAGYPLDLRSFYPLLPCWQYPAWSYQSSASLLQPTPNKIPAKKSLSFNSKPKPTVSTRRPNQDLPSASKNEALTFHLHTHHHHHIHNSNSSSLSKPSNHTKTTAIPSSPDKPSCSLLNPKEQLVESKVILPLGVNNVAHKECPSITEDDALNLSINNNNKSNVNQENGATKKTTRRKSSPVKRRVTTSGVKLETTPINTEILPPRKALDHNQANVIQPVSNQLSIIEQKVVRRSIKRRSVSAAVVTSTTVVSPTRRSLRGNRTISASSVPSRSKSSLNRKRSYSPVSRASLSPNRRKKTKISYYWVLFGKSSRQLVSVHADKPPVFRECYSSIRHVTEKDVIKSNDCVILRPESGKHNGATPYLAKVKWFWEEPTSGEIQMSLLWYYHPEHTELPARVKGRFLLNELLASRYSDCVNVACIEDKCYVLNLNEYNRYCLREASANLFEHSESVGQLKSLLNKNTSSVHHRSLPAKTVGSQNVFFCRYVYDYRVKRISKNPSLTNPNTTMTSNS